MGKSSDNDAVLTHMAVKRKGKWIGVRDMDCSIIPKMLCPDKLGFLRPKSAIGGSFISLE